MDRVLQIKGFIIMSQNCIIISATHRSSGKTTVTIGLCAALSQLGLKIQPFKKGPDYIDPMWLTAASGRDCRTLDLFMMKEQALLESFQSASKDADLSIIEGNMGFYDGLDIGGRDSTAYLSSLLKTPVILIVDASRMTRGIAPLVLGYQQFEPDNLIVGIILNKVASSRHETKLRQTLDSYCKIEVLGALPVLKEIEITQRHLGLIPFKEVAENKGFVPVIGNIAEIVKKYVDLSRIIDLSRFVKPVSSVSKEKKIQPRTPIIKLGIAKDPAFTFYYPENLNSLCIAGANLIPFNTLFDRELPQVDGLYLGGGFPEIFIDALSENKSLRKDIKSLIEKGMPVYAECGGLMYLSKSISYKGITREMVNALDCDIRVFEKPQGHGYVILQSTANNKWFNFDEEVRGHEFHYSQVINSNTSIRELDFGYQLIRGKGVNGKNDGIIYKNVIASYTHFHSIGTPQWAEQFVKFVKKGNV